jgi:phospholipase/carboxylesterase
VAIIALATYTARLPPYMIALNGPRLAPTRGQATHLVVLCHGYGADGNDLIGLAPHWQRLLPTTAFVAPNAPERCAPSPSGYQWFPLKRIDPHEIARGVEAAAPTLDAFLDAELKRLNLSSDRLALVGFSQGTMMALHVGLRRKPTPLAIVGFSGLLVSPEKLPAFETPGPPVLLTHGDADQTIPFAAMFQSVPALGRAGLVTRWHVSHGLGHGIDGDGLALGGQFLADSFAGRLAPSAFPISCILPPS